MKNFILIIATIFPTIIFAQSFFPSAKPVCDCYYNRDCTAGHYCKHEGCSHSGKLDGSCSLNPKVSDVDFATIATAVDLWLKAYEYAGEHGGGGPNLPMILIAQNLPIDSEKKSLIPPMCFHIVAMYAGLTTYPNLPNRFGYLEYPSDTPGKENGYIYALPTPELTVGQIVRQAIVQEILTKGQANAFDSNMNRIITEAPTYQTYGRCLYPHPV